jgi:HEAT repeat protein
MLNRFRTIGLCLLAVTSLAVGLAAQQPGITNGQLTPRSAGSPLGQSFQALVAAQGASADSVTWIGYAVPVVDNERIMCCFDGGTSWINGNVASSNGQTCCRTCRLEPLADGTSMARRAPSGTGSNVVRLEPSDRMTVLIRVAAREIDRVRVFSDDCELDAGGRQVIWLNDVRPADSVALLESFTASTQGRRDRVTDGAISAIALHGDPSADSALERLVNPSQPESIRKKVTFWLGNSRRGPGLAVLKRVLKDDPSAEVQKGAVFGVSQSHERDAFETLASTAKSHANAKIRGEALFWMAQQGDARAAAQITDALENDASPEVRKKAVFALSQLKDDAGVDSLVRIARTGKDAAVRGEAIFWLGQKAGRRASDAITERIDQDPDTEVKKKAVFALSQMPKDEGIPLLINVARNNSNPAVRKQAMFWLGQSKDQRAIDFFAEILKK